MSPPSVLPTGPGACLPGVTPVTHAESTLLDRSTGPFAALLKSKTSTDTAKGETSVPAQAPLKPTSKDSVNPSDVSLLPSFANFVLPPVLPVLTPVSTLTGSNPNAADSGAIPPFVEKSPSADPNLIGRQSPILSRGSGVNTPDRNSNPLVVATSPRAFPTTPLLGLWDRTPILANPEPLENSATASTSDPTNGDASFPTRSMPGWVSAPPTPAAAPTRDHKSSPAPLVSSAEAPRPTPGVPLQTIERPQRSVSATIPAAGHEAETTPATASGPGPVSDEANTPKPTADLVVNPFAQAPPPTQLSQPPPHKAAGIDGSRDVVPRSHGRNNSMLVNPSVETEASPDPRVLIRTQIAALPPATTDSAVFDLRGAAMDRVSAADVGNKGEPVQPRFLASAAEILAASNSIQPLRAGPPKSTPTEGQAATPDSALADIGNKGERVQPRYLVSAGEILAASTPVQFLRAGPQKSTPTEGQASTPDSALADVGNKGEPVQPRYLASAGEILAASTPIQPLRAGPPKSAPTEGQAVTPDSALADVANKGGRVQPRYLGSAGEILAASTPIQSLRAGPQKSAPTDVHATPDSAPAEAFADLLLTARTWSLRPVSDAPYSRPSSPRSGEPDVPNSQAQVPSNPFDSISTRTGSPTISQATPQKNSFIFEVNRLLPPGNSSTQPIPDQANPEPQIFTPEPSANLALTIHGTPNAAQGLSMELRANRNNIAEPLQRELPPGGTIASATERREGSSTDEGARDSKSEFDLSLLAAPLQGAGPSTHFVDVQSAPPVTAEKVPIRLETLQSQISSQVKSMLQASVGGLDVILKPDPRTEIKLRLVRRGDRLEASAQCSSRDYDSLNSGWTTLQAGLATQGITLQPLTEAPAGSMNTEKSTTGNSDQSDPKGQNSPSRVFETSESAPSPARPGLPSTHQVRPRTSRLLESWA